MKHIFVGFFIFFSIVLSLFSYGTANASITSKFTSKLLTKGFGGKVLLSPIPGLVCIGRGLPILLSSNIGGAINVAKSSVTPNQSGTSRAMGIAAGVYGMIPTYTTNPLKLAQVGGYILGMQKIIPNFTICKIGDVPIPVLKTTDTYGVTGLGGASGAIQELAPKILQTTTPGLAPIPTY